MLGIYYTVTSKLIKLIKVNGQQKLNDDVDGGGGGGVNKRNTK